MADSPTRDQLDTFLAAYEESWEIVKSAQIAELDPLGIDTFAKEDPEFRGELERIEAMHDLVLRDKIMAMGKKGKSVNVLLRLAATRMSEFQETLRITGQVSHTLSPESIAIAKASWRPELPPGPVNEVVIDVSPVPATD